MKILIVSLHVRRSAQAVPLAAGNLKAALPPQLQQTTQLLDLYLQQPISQMLEMIQAAKAELIAFTLYLWNRSQVVQLAQDLRELNAPPFLLVGGPEASADSARLLATGAFDGVVRGEGEESFALLAARISRGEDVTGIPGLCLGPERPAAEACCCAIEQLKSPWLSNILQPVAGGVLWEVARGCPFNCSFCYDAKGMAGVRPLPRARLAAELESFCANGAEQVWVLDSSFNAPAERGQRLLQLLIDEAPQLHYHLEAKAEFIDKKTIALLAQLSCSIQLGLQSADSAVLAGLNRKINPEKFWRGVEMLARSGLTFGLDLIYGLPGDSEAGFGESLNRALSYAPNQLDIFPLAVLPGTELYRQKAAQGIQAADQPPYLLEQSADFSTGEMQNCAALAAAVDLFYNLGRAVGFLLPCCDALQTKPLSLLEEFRDWFRINVGDDEALRTADRFRPQEILQLQRGFLCQRFQAAGKQRLLPLVEDILTYHFQYAETLLGAETSPVQNSPVGEKPFRLAAGVALVEFQCDILCALETEAIDLLRWERLIERTPTTCLMIRRGGQVYCELLTAEFAELLRRAQQPQSRSQLLAGLEAQEAAELLQFALTEGLVIEMIT